ncbi:unnamed protein product [Allacma fusca]|uniref:Uncharacterized protein n=1 Tax=Allacma fusca TaxID=39272 RepID=A0A8J2JLR6_9HEXA|nr:unnamed protein product [Allacma fusca]
MYQRKSNSLQLNHRYYKDGSKNVIAIFAHRKKLRQQRQLSPRITHVPADDASRLLLLYGLQNLLQYIVSKFSSVSSQKKI